MRLLLLDNYDSFTWNLYHSISKVHAEVDVARNDEITVGDAAIYDALVISPGPGLPRESGILPLLIPAFAGRKPVLGICLGHQAIAEYYGAELYNLDTVVHGRERECILTGVNDPVYDGISNSFVAGRYHSWVIDPATVPDDLLVTATNRNGQIMSIRHRKHAVWGLQYHPESIMTPDGDRIVDNWIKHCLLLEQTA